MSLRPSLVSEAVALRPYRVFQRGKKEISRTYEGTTFPAGPSQGCELVLRGCAAFGGMVDDSEREYAVVDVLDAAGDIVQEYRVNGNGFRYLRRVLRFRIETDETRELPPPHLTPK